MVRLALLGDVMLGRLVDQAIAGYGPEYVWGDTLPVLRKADLRIANLECVISDKGSPWTKTPKVFHFRAGPAAGEAHAAAKIDCVSLANNHSMDFGEEALLDMLERLDRAGIRHAGAGPGLKEAMEPAVLEARGLKVALISATDNESAWLAGQGRPGTDFLPTLIRPEVFGKIGELATLARGGGADIVVFSDHWGPNMRRRPDPLFISFARQVVDLGIDVFHGHSAHLFQGIGLMGRKPVLFDTGDFVDDYAVDPDMRNDWSFIFTLEIDKRARRVRSIELTPVVISRCQVNLAEDLLAGAICDRMETLCREMGTRARKDGLGLVIDI
jgi:poly-gamma-glutamate capsule biosynthesis protein CapA/YwtB (metallophosphatase superfamily)